MELHVMLFAFLAFAILVLCLCVAWMRKHPVIRWGLIAAGIVVAGSFYPAMVNLLSRPRDVTEEWYNRDAKEALVAGAYVNEGVALYLYLKLPGVIEPRSYKFPWSDETRQLAQAVEGALDSKEGQANGVIIPFPFKNSLEREHPLTAMPLPQTAPPLKQQPRAPMQFKGTEARFRILDGLPWWRQILNI